MCIFHKYISVEDVDHSLCGECFVKPNRIGAELIKRYPKGFCPHSFSVCTRCGKAVGYGSHGELTVVPDTCKKQIMKMKESHGWK
jgi:hypothetical protein